MQQLRNVLLMQLLIATCVGQLPGCNKNITPGKDIAQATLVSFEELKEATKDDVHFYWWGSDKKYHYFETPKGFYCLPESFKMERFDRQVGIMIQQNTAPGTIRTAAFINQYNLMDFYPGEEAWQPSK
jgi:hypothetical protein